MATIAEQDYLKAIYMLTREGQAASTSGIAEYLGLRAASVSGMLSRLASRPSAPVHYEKHAGARLSAAGRTRALQLLRKHRLIETWLCRELGYGWEEVHEEADHLEHSMSDRLIERLARRLGDPEYDPHGDPIPRANGSLPEAGGICVLDLEEGRRATVLRVRDGEPELLVYLGNLGIRPEKEVVLLELAPFNGPARLELGGETASIGREAAAAITVRPQEERE